MGLIRKIWNGIKRVFGRYEAAFQKWGQRSWLGQSYQDARLDVDAATRMELQRRHRYWVANSALVNRIRNLFIQFSVGVSGLKVVPNSENEDWNHSRQESWQAWGRQPDLSSRLTLGQLCIQWAGALFDDGEVFIYKVAEKVNGGSIPRLQTIEGHRVQTPPELKEQEGKTIFDGVVVNKNGMPIKYHVRDSMPDKDGQATYRAINAADVIHIFKARRPGMYRGIPEGFSGMNTLHDYEDLHVMEMQVAKMASAIGNVETNSTGEVDLRNTRRARLDTTSQTSSGQTITKNVDQYYRVQVGSQWIAMKAGDSIKQFQVDRPAIATQNYWDLLISQICCAYNVPKLLVVPYSLQGTVTRADLDICANAFRVNFELIAWALQQIYEWQTQWAVDFDRSMDGAKPADFLSCIIQPPRAPNVDIGYTADALSLELAMGTKTLQDTYAERQQDWRVQLRQIAETRKYIKDLAKEFELEPEEIVSNPQQQIPPENDPAEEAAEGEPAPEAATAP